MTARRSLLLSLRNVGQTLAICAPTLVDAARGKVTRQACDRRLEAWASSLVEGTKMRIGVSGRGNLEASRLFHPGEGRCAPLVMSNHQSHYDVAVLFHVLGPRLRMIAKRELFGVPVFGSAMRVAGFISIDRTDRTSAIASLEDAKKSLATGVPIWIAPEGTRSPTGELLPFKKGGFVLAVAAGAPILPVSIRGTRDILPAKGLRSRPEVDVHVTIHPQIDPNLALSPKEARDALAVAVREAIASGL